MRTQKVLNLLKKTLDYMERSIRQQVQAGRYILFPNHIKEAENVPMFELLIDPIPKDSEYIIERIRIPGKHKEKLLKQLRMMGISKATLFCDSIDMVCEGIVDICNRLQ